MTLDTNYSKAILNNSPESIVLIGKNHEILTFNRTIQNVLSQFFGKEIKVGDLYYPNYVVDSNKDLYLKSFQKAINGEPVYVQNLTENENASLWFEYEVFPVYDESGEIFGVSLSAKNITTEKLKEIKIKEMSNNLKAILENTTDSIILLDLEYKITLLNNIAKSAISRNITEVEIGMDYRQFIPDLSDPFYEYFQKTLNGIYSEIEIPQTNIMGETVWFQKRFNPVYNEFGKLIGVSIFSRDITDRKIHEKEIIKSKEKIEESEYRLKLASDTANLGIWDWDIKNNILTWDNKMFELFGKETNSDINKFETWENSLYFEDKETAISKLNDALYGNMKFDTSYRILKNNGEIAHIKATGIVLKDENSNPYRMIGINQDITLLANTIINLKEANNVISERVKELNCLYNISEICRNPKNSLEYIINKCTSLIRNAYQHFEITCIRITLQGNTYISENFIESKWFQSANIYIKGDKLGIIEVFYTEEKPKAFEGPFLKEERLLINSIADILGNTFELKETENKLKQFKHFFENSHDFLNIANVNGFCEVINPKMIKSLGYSKQELLQNKYYTFIHPDDWAATNKAVEELKKGQLTSDFTIRHRKKNGEYIWIEWNVSSNVVSGKLYSIGRDITERRKNEEKLALSALIINSSDDAIISKTPDNIITSWNRGAEKMFGYNAEEVINNSINMLIPANLQEEETYISQKILNGESVDHFETRRIKKNGEEIIISLTVSPIFENSKKVIGASKIIRDITLQKTLELEREKIISDLAQRNRDLEQFAYIVSHNLRAPVANIIGISRFLQSNELTTDENTQLILELSKCVSGLDMVIKDLNQILKTQREISESKIKVKLSEILKDIQISIANLIEKEKVFFSVDFSKIDEISTIKSYLYSILYNLISNSIKYKHPENSPIIEIRSILTDKGFKIIFKDNGMGIDMEKQGKYVFGLYKRFHFHTEGKGMGLYMVKTQVEALGGKVSIKSEVNNGTEFNIEFKL